MIMARTSETRLNPGIMKALRSMSDMQRRVLTAIADSIEQGQRPSRKDLNEVVQFAYSTGVTRYITSLDEMGALKREYHAKRNIDLTPEGWAALHRAYPFGGMPLLDAVPDEQIPMGELPGSCRARVPQLGYLRGHFAVQVDLVMTRMSSQLQVGDFLVCQAQPLLNPHQPHVAVHDECVIPFLEVRHQPKGVIGRIVGHYRSLNDH
jgi:hypothetical protein